MLSDKEVKPALNLLQYYVSRRLEDDEYATIDSIRMELLKRTDRVGQHRYYREWIIGTRDLPRTLVDSLRLIILQDFYSDDTASDLAKILQLT